MLEYRYGKQSAAFIEWCKRHYSRVIANLPKNTSDDFTTQEREIVRVLNDPKITIDNKTTDDITAKFDEIVRTFPIESELGDITDYDSLSAAMDIFIAEKNGEIPAGA